jgi:hypothetical protein
MLLIFFFFFQFMEEMVVKYDKAAKEKDVLIVPACGFDSAIADMGSLWTASQFRDGCCSAIESIFYISKWPKPPLKMSVNYGTYETAVYGTLQSFNIFFFNILISSFL